MVVVTGATGFIGRHLVQRLCREGHAVRCLVRADSDRSAMPTERCEFAVGDVTDRASLIAAMHGAGSVVHLVGIIIERRRASFEAIHVNGTRNVVEAAREAGVRRCVHVSALGTRAQAVSRYHQTKWQAEQLVRGGEEAGEGAPGWTIIRPSIVFGPGDGFTTSILSLLRKGPVIPIPGSGAARLQPIFIEDLTACIAWCLAHEEALGQTYEVAGPEQLSFERVADLVAQQVGVRKRKVHVPIPVMFLIACAQEVLCREPEVTVDQLKMLSEHNVCEPTVLKDVFGIEATGFEDGLRRFL